MTHWTATTSAFALKRGVELRVHQTIRGRANIGIARGDDVEIRLADGTRMAGEVVRASIRGVLVTVGGLTITIRRAPKELEIPKERLAEPSVWVITRCNL